MLYYIKAEEAGSNALYDKRVFCLFWRMASLVSGYENMKNIKYHCILLIHFMITCSREKGCGGSVVLETELSQRSGWDKC